MAKERVAVVAPLVHAPHHIVHGQHVPHQPEHSQDQDDRHAAQDDGLDEPSQAQGPSVVVALSGWRRGRQGSVGSALRRCHRRLARRRRRGILSQGRDGGGFVEPGLGTLVLAVSWSRNAWNTGVRVVLQILLAHHTMPAIADQVSPESLVLDGQIVARQVRDEEIGDQHADHAGDRGDDEGPSDAEMVFDGLENLRSHRRACLAKRGADAVARPADGGRVALAGHESEHVA